MASVLAGIVTSYGAWRTVRWLVVSESSASTLAELGPEDWLKRTDLAVMLFTLEFYTRKHGKKKYIKALEEQRLKVEKLMDELQDILLWKNEGWRYAYRSWLWSGEKKAFRKLKDEHAVLVKRLELLKTLEK